MKKEIPGFNQADVELTNPGINRRQLAPMEQYDVLCAMAQQIGFKNREKVMFTIWKETLKVADHQTLLIPAGSTIISIKQQGGEICIWFLCDKNASKKEYNFMIKSTGHFIDRSDLKKTPNFVGTVVQNFFVWHVFTDCIVKSNA